MQSEILGRVVECVEWHSYLKSLQKQLWCEGGGPAVGGPIENRAKGVGFIRGRKGWVKFETVGCFLLKVEGLLMSFHILESRAKMANLFLEKIKKNYSHKRRWSDSCSHAAVGACWSCHVHQLFIPKRLLYAARSGSAKSNDCLLPVGDASLCYKHALRLWHWTSVCPLVLIQPCK